MIHATVLALISLVVALGPLGDIPLPIFPPSEPPPTPPPAPEQPPPPPSQDPDGFPNVGKALFADSGEGAAARIWGLISCVDAERVSKVKRRVGAGGPDPFRKLTVRDGDDYYGERCELGFNDHLKGPTALYREGSRLITVLSLRLAKRFPIRSDDWQVVTQMKQTQPADDGGGVGMLNLQVYGGRWRLTDRSSELWSAPARTRRWTRFSFDVRYSDSPTEGTLQVAADLNGDGDAHDANERSRRLSIATLKTEGPGTDADGVPEGTAIPSHLRAGIYHDPAYDCAEARCSIGIDDIGIYRPR